jgi:hypothetical protein
MVLNAAGMVRPLPVELVHRSSKDEKATQQGRRDKELILFAARIKRPLSRSNAHQTDSAASQLIHLGSICSKPFHYRGRRVVITILNSKQLPIFVAEGKVV